MIYSSSFDIRPKECLKFSDLILIFIGKVSQFHINSGMEIYNSYFLSNYMLHFMSKYIVMLILVIMLSMPLPIPSSLPIPPLPPWLSPQIIIITPCGRVILFSPCDNSLVGIDPFPHFHINVTTCCYTLQKKEKLCVLVATKTG